MAEYCRGFKTIPIPKKIQSKKINAEQHLLFSDNHVGSFITEQETGFFGSYTFDEFSNRCDKLIDKLHHFKETHMSIYNVNKLVIHMLGDIVEGEGINYKSQVWHINPSVLHQIFSGGKKIIDIIRAFAGIYPEVEIFCVWGNHGRLDPDRSYKEETSNWDNVIYMYMRDILNLIQPNVKMFISESRFMIVRHGDYHFFLAHGDEITRWMGLPYYGLDRMAANTSRMVNLLINYIQIGHHHREAQIEIPYGDEMINGTMAGPNTLGINRYNMALRPSQTTYFFHHKEGIFDKTRVYLAEPVYLKEDKNRILTPHFS